MKLALSMLCENPGRRTGLSTLFHEFVAHALVLRPDLSWVLFAGPNQPWTIDDPRVEVVRRFPANDRPYARLLADHLRVAPEARRRGADVLLTVGFMPVCDAGLPVVMHVFSVHHLGGGGGLRMAYRRWAMRRGIARARLVIANSQWTAAQLAAAYGLEAEPVGSDVVALPASTAPHASARRQVTPPMAEAAQGGGRTPTAGDRPELVVSYEGLQHERFRPEGTRGRKDLPAEYLLWTSNFYGYKRAELALAAYAGLSPATRTRFPLVLVGGDWRGGRGRAEATARRLGISDQVRFLGWVGDAELPALYRGARAHVLSTEEETFGRSVVEAMACGCPCVLQDLAVLREVAGGAAVFTDFAVAAAAAAELERVCLDDGLAAELRAAGVRRAAVFSFETLTRQRLEAVTRACGAKFATARQTRARIGDGPPGEGIPRTTIDDCARRLKHRARTGAQREKNISRWGAAGVCAVAGAAVFQWFGNANHGYIDTHSLFWWWGWQWWNPASETQHGWLVLALSVWLLARNLRSADCGVRTAECDRETDAQERAKIAEEGRRQSGNAENGKTSAVEGTIEGRGLKHRATSDSRSPNPQPSTLNSSSAAVAAMLGGFALHAVGFAAQQARVSILALLLFTWGVLRLGGGRRWGGAAVFPLAFMVFAIPVNVLDSLGFWLRLWVIHASTAIAHAAGMGVIENGTNLIAPDGRYQYDVAAACSGVRSLMALAALSLLIGYLNFRSGWRRGLLLLLCFPLVYLGNLARITAIVFAAQAGGPRWGDVTHEVMGWAIFGIVLGGVLGTAGLLRRFAPEKRREARGERLEEGNTDQQEVAEGAEGGTPERNAECGVRSAEWDPSNAAAGGGSVELGQSAIRNPQSAICTPLASRLWPIVAIVVVLALAEMALLNRLATRPARGEAGVALAADGRSPVELPAILEHGWVGLPAAVTPIEREILPPDTGFSRMQYVSSRQPRRVFLSIVLSGRDRTSIHRPELCLLGQGWTITGRQTHRFTAPAGENFPATVLRVVHKNPAGGGVVPSLVAYWFVGDDRVVATHWQRLGWDAWYRIVHGRADRWAYVLLQTDASDGGGPALARMQQVLDGTLPVFEPNRADAN